nr:RUS1 family protein C16orf58 homolog [Maniola hyperantus]
MHITPKRDQANVVIVKNKKTSSIVGILKKILLPQGYPNSVSKDYLAYQKWDTAQAFCSTIMGILATQAVLQGVGVGDQMATPLAATVTWVLKDGCGHLGRIIFAYSHGSNLDAYSKKWRMYADVLNDVAMCIEIALPIFPVDVAYALCISTILKSIVGVAGGATRIAMTQHHAIRGNMGDVSAKDSAQETAVNLVASVTALFIITYLGGSLVISIVFVVMMILHVVFNYFAVRTVCLKTLNEPRFLKTIEIYLKNEVVATPCEINGWEPIIFYQIGTYLLDLKMCGFQIKLGKSLTHIVQYSPKASYLKNMKGIYSENQYIIIPNVNKRIMYVFIKEYATVNDILQAYFHAVLLATVTLTITGHFIVETKPNEEPRPFAKVCKILQQTKWSPVGSNRSLEALYEPPFELVSYVRDIATKEWPNLKMGLLQTGWDLSKHLLMVDEWRVTSDFKFEVTYPENWSPEHVRLYEDAGIRHSTPKDRKLRDTFTLESLSAVDSRLLASTQNTSYFENGDYTESLPPLSDTYVISQHPSQMPNTDSEAEFTESRLMRDT